MKGKIFITLLLMVGFLIGTTIPVEAHRLPKPVPPRPRITISLETQIARELAQKYNNAEVEYVLWDKTRVDLLNEEYAIELDWAEKWAEAIGQSLYYAALTGKKPAIILLYDPKTDSRFVYRCQTVCMKYNIKLYLEPTSVKNR